MELNHTHDASARSWVASANVEGADFPIQNLPFAVFRRAGSDESFRGGVAIGDQVIDLRAAADGLGGAAGAAARACDEPALNAFMGLGPAAWRALRHALFAALRQGATDKTGAAAVCASLVPMCEVEHQLAARIGDYSDFYTSQYHALNSGRARNPNAQLSPNFTWMPIAYHGRASSVNVGGSRFHRPHGQSMPAGAAQPVYGPCARLDYELELAIWIGAGNAAGKPIALADAEDHIFGFGLLNDWSARDIQFWEMAPLGPFLGKSFCTSVSPWVVTQEALAPFRLPFDRSAAEPAPLPYLDSPGNRAQGRLDIELAVWIESARMRSAGLLPAQVSRTNFRHQYWTVAQMVAHHTVNGCNLQSGDLFGSGTVSGPTPSEAGSIIELTKGGTQPIRLDGAGETRAFLEDGDVVILRGWCEKPGFARIGFGECRGEVLPAVGASPPA
jgi:fumarylacetoacetase